MPTAATTTTAARRASALPPTERRAAIIDAVRPLLIEYGESVTTKQIACAAGIAEGTIFRVFADKDELLDAALEDALDPEPLETALSRIDSTQPFVRQLVEATAIIQRRVVDVWMLVSNLGPKRHEQSRRPMVDSAALAAIFAAHPDQLTVDPTTAAHMLRALTLSLTHPMLAGHPADPAEIVHLLLHGIGTAP
ncbi:MAG TPA: helix-turn-helix domain-containing protein [Ilumatobacteraceae bacterium]|nr:helix-turn-helix domain-containing protein [Ilumatobacteraceae bacterium]